jgi:hypothetical protein
MNTIDERIRRKAHELWEIEGKPNGRSEDHWAEAKRQIEQEDRAGGNKASDTMPRTPIPDPLAVTGVQTTVSKT